MKKILQSSLRRVKKVDCDCSATFSAIGCQPPTCFSGHHGPLETMTWTTARMTRGEDWFQIYLDEVLVVLGQGEGSNRGAFELG